MLPLLVLVLVVIFFLANDSSSQPFMETSSAATLNDALTKATIATMTEWRAKTHKACQSMLKDNAGRKFGKDTLDKKEELERDAVALLSLPKSVSGTRSSTSHQSYEYCRNVFIDLGTNIGDSIGHFVDNALDVCSPIYKNITGHNPRELLPRPHLDVTDLKITHNGQKDNPLFKMLQSGVKVSPDTFCVYGMEGNPEFTERLQKLENYIMDMKPRPVRHLHIHTESVVTAVDGPTKLFLDKTSVAENFWGSSILSSQQDAQKSAKELGNGQVFSADVQGITLSSLVKNTALAFKPGATTDEQTGGTLIVKMDVEGAEYQVIKEVAKSGVLCDLVKKGNRVLMIVEYHMMSITDAVERKREQKGHGEAKTVLTDCGVQFGKLSASWH